MTSVESCASQVRPKTVIVAQLVEWLLAIPEVRGSNPVIGKIYMEHLFPVNCIEKTKIKKEAGNVAFFKKNRGQSFKPSMTLKL